jgi:hypothetical protein
MKVNGKEVVWEDAPKGHYLIDVKIHVLWRDEKTGAQFQLLKAPVGGRPENPHVHPDANQYGLMISGEIELADGTKMTAGEDNYMFGFNPKGKEHAYWKGAKLNKECLFLMYYDGPSTKVF